MLPGGYRVTLNALALALGLGFLAMACAPAQEPPAAGPEGSGGPKYGGRLNVWVTADPTSWDVSISGVSSVSDRWRARAYEGVLRFKAGPDVDAGALILEPSLAERWEVSPDGRTYTFHLRKGVNWQNVPPVDGREFTSADVKFSWDYASRTGEFKDRNLKRSFFSWLFEGMESVETPDRSMVVVKFKEPFAPFINYVAHSKNPMYAREVFDREGHFEETLIGTGAFILDGESSQRGSRWVMKKNPDYWDRGKPYLDELRGLVLPAAGTAFAAFQTKQLDLLGGGGGEIRHEDVKQIKADVPEAVVQTEQREAPRQVYLNVRRSPFDNLLVRRALNRALDREEFSRALTAGEGLWGISGAYPHDLFTQDEIRQLQPYDPEEAKRLLAQAGYPTGLDVEFLASSAYGSSYLTMVELMQAQLRKVGVRFTIKTLDHAAYLAQTRGNTYDLTIRSRSIMGDVDSWLYANFHPAADSNYGGVNDPELTPLIQQQRRETDAAKRRETVRQAIKMISEKAWSLSLHYEVDSHLWHPYVKGYARNLGVDGWPLIDVWLEK